MSIRAKYKRARASAPFASRRTPICTFPRSAGNIGPGSFLCRGFHNGLLYVSTLYFSAGLDACLDPRKGCQGYGIACILRTGAVSAREGFLVGRGPTPRVCESCVSKEPSLGEAWTLSPISEVPSSLQKIHTPAHL